MGRAALPAPGGRAELQDWASSFFSQRIDRLRPLWEMVIVEGLADDRWALATKTHHCMVDGVGSVDVGHLILDLEAHPKRRPPPRDLGHQARPGADASRGPERERSDPLGRLVKAWSGLLPVDTIANAAQAGAHGVLHPREAVKKAAAALEMVAREEIRAAPHTSLNQPIGIQRRFEVVPVPLAAIKAIRAELGGTVNDVVLAVVASGLKALLESRGEMPPEQGVRAMVPMNVRSASEKLALGNKISSLFIDLPVCEPDPVRRYRETAARSSRPEVRRPQRRGHHRGPGHRRAGAADHPLHDRPGAVCHAAVQRDHHQRARAPADALRVREPAAARSSRWCRWRRSTPSAWRSSATTATRSSAWSPTATPSRTST